MYRSEAASARVGRRYRAAPPPRLYCAPPPRRQNGRSVLRAAMQTQAMASLREVVTFSKKATDASIATGKRLKNTEITLRKMVEKFRDVKAYRYL